ncbi:MAG: hypothetical protein F9K23_15745 [Bacteroidetes bacterium]|nr:MAG: hypothetical protein F9K23_15745 [Bacteroidota bacterium]
MQYCLWNYKMRIRFILRKNAISSTGLAPLYCRIIINGRESNKFSVGIVIPVKNWDSKKQVVIGQATDNMKLNQIKTDLDAIYLNLKATNAPLDPETIRKKFTARGSQQIAFLNLFELFLTEQKKGGKVTLSTIGSHASKKNTIALFLKQNGIGGLLAVNFKPTIATRLYDWLLGESGISNNKTYACRILQLVKRVLRFGVSKEYFDYSPLANETFKREPKKDKKRLLPADVRRLELLCPHSESLARVRDIFLFLCYTGFEYKDLKKFNPEQIINFDGVDMIMHARAKNGNMCAIPVTTKIRVLLDSYKDGWGLISNQKFNDHLKTLSTEAGLNVNLSSGWGRKTFGTTKVSFELFSLETTAKMMGHASINTTAEYYVDILPERVALEVKDKVAKGVYTI